MLSPNGVLDRLNISRHPEGTERNPQSFCYCDALVNIPVLAGLICHRKISKHRHSERSEESHKYYEILRQTPQDDNRRHCPTRNRIIGERCRIGAVDLTKKAAFTLSEVLITIGIIGVVAALVMGVIIPQIQDRQNIAKWKKEYSIVSNAFQQTLSEGLPICDIYSPYGPCCREDNIYYPKYSQDFLDSMMSKLRVIDYCVSTYPAEKRCDYYSVNHKNAKYKWAGIANIYSQYRTLGNRTETKNNGYNTYGVHSYSFDRAAYLLNDGAVLYVGEDLRGLWIGVDVNGFSGGPNEIGRDLFFISIKSDVKTDEHWMKPAGAQGTPGWNDDTKGISGCSKDIGVSSIQGSDLTGAAGLGCSAKYIGNF